MIHDVHIAILSVDRSRVALVGSPRQWALPHVRAPRCSRVPSHVQRLLARCGIDAGLRLLSAGYYDRRQDELHHLAIAMVAGDEFLPPGLAWARLDALAIRDGGIAHQRGLLPYLRRALDGSPARTGAQNLQWPDHVQRFLREHGLIDDGQPLRCRVHRVATRRVVCEITQPTRRLFVYCGEPGTYDEGAIVRIMHDAAPDLVPAVLAHDATRGWWVAPAVDGDTLGTRPPSGGGRALARTIGRLQAVSIEHLDSLSAAGVPWLSPSELNDALVKVLPRGSTVYERVRARIDEVPWNDRPCLVHLDPHPGNVIQNRAGELTVIDWERCAIAPFEIGHALLALFVRDAAPAWYDPREIRVGFLEGAGLAAESDSVQHDPIDAVDIQIVNLAIAARVGLTNLEGSDLIGTRTLMQRNLAIRLERCIGAHAAG